MRHFTTIIAGTLLLGLLLTPRPAAAGVDFMNFTYKVNPCGSSDGKTPPPPVAMQKGKAFYAIAVDAGFDLQVERLVEGSLAPGTRQAVVVISCHYPVDGGAAGAYLFEERNTTARFVQQVGEAQWGGDWGEPSETIHIRFANGFLYVDQCKSVTHCIEGSDFVVTTYARRDGKIVKVYQETHKRSTYP